MKTILALLLVALLAGCTDNESDKTEPKIEDDGEEMGISVPQQVNVSIEIRTSGTYPIDPAYNKDLEVPAGANVTLTFYNDDANSVVEHDWYADIDGAATPRIGSGESVTINFIAPEPGDYQFWCSVGNHRSSGMEGTLTVV